MAWNAEASHQTANGEQAEMHSQIREGSQGLVFILAPGHEICFK